MALPFRGARAALTGVLARPIGRVALFLAGIRLRVEGAERLQNTGPAIVVMNHSSGLDLPIMMSWMPPRPVALGKKEVAFVPIFGQAYVLSGGLLIDRAHHDEAVASLGRAAAVVTHHRLSVVMSPEGTRSPDGRLLAFKRGVAHLAVQTGLPILPMVIEGAHLRWPLHTWALTPGEIRVRFLPPIPTTGWRAETAGDHADALRQVFIDNLPPDQRPLTPTSGANP